MPISIESIDTPSLDRRFQNENDKVLKGVSMK